MKIIYLSATLLLHSEVHPNMPMRLVTTESTYFDPHAECAAKARREIADLERQEKRTFVRVFDGFFCEVDPLRGQELTGQKQHKSPTKRGS